MSYLDTQLSRLGSPNFHQIPINAPKCPFANFQRDGHMQMGVPPGRANYEPNSIAADGPRETPGGIRTVPVPTERKVRERSLSFSDHYSQARMFYRSVTPQEQMHIAAALAFELGKVAIEAIRERVLGHLQVIDSTLAAEVADRLGITRPVTPAQPFVAPTDMDLSPALRLYGKYQPTLKGRKVGVLLGTGFDASLMESIEAAVLAEGAAIALIGMTAAGAQDADGKVHPVQMALAASPSVLFDHVCVISGEKGDMRLAQDPDAVQFLMDAGRHLKVIGLSGVEALAEEAGIAEGNGILDISGNVAAFITMAKAGKVWEREPGMRPQKKSSRKKN